MARIPAEPRPFFSLSPAQAGQANCFAAHIGEDRRLDVSFNHPRYEAFEARIDAAGIPAPTLGELVESVSSGATPSRDNAELYADSGVRFMRILNVVDGAILEDDMKHVTQAVHDGELKRSQLAAGDVLMTITGRVGSAAVVRESHLPANINQHIVRLRVDQNAVNPEYLSDWLNSPTGLALSNRPTSGGTRIALDYKAILAMRIPLPSLDEQARLAADIADARAERKAKLAEADALLAGLDDFTLSELGIAPPEEDDRRVFAVRLGDMSGRSLSPARYAPVLHRFIDALRNHPAADKPLSAYVEINPSDGVAGLAPDATVGFVPMQAIADGATGEHTVAERPLREVSKGYTQFADGDILWAKMTPCLENGKVCIVDNLPNGIGFGSTEFHVLRAPRNGAVLTEFVREFISQASLRRVVARASSGSAQQRIPAAFLASLPFPAVPLERQREIVASVRAARERARRLRGEAEAGWVAARAGFEAGLLG